MPLESATYITDLVPANPAHSDGLNQTDSHLRLIKQVLQTVFPSLSGPVTCTPTELNQLHTGTRSLGLSDGSSGAPSIYFDSEAGLGFYRVSAGHLAIPAGKRLQGPGTVDVGIVVPFIKDPGSTLCARGGTATGTEEYIEPDGSTYNNSAFPDLATFLGQGGSTFTVPDWKTAGKFLRHRTGAVTVGTAQTSQNKSHTHALTTGVESAAHQHSVPGVGVSVSVNTTTAAAGGNTVVSGVTLNTSSVTSGFDSLDHTHTGTSGTGSADGTEARPEAYVVYYAIKT
jgi:hypothetical protein